MDHGYIYVLSNPAFHTGLLKIGLTRGTPDDRARELSRAAAIPSDFVVEHSTRVSDVKKAETRIHLMLRDYRHRPQKEFFQLTVQEATLSVDKAQMLLDKFVGFADMIRKHPVLIYALPTKSISHQHYKLLNLMMAATQDNGLIVRRDRAQRKVVDGFMSVSTLLDAGILQTADVGYAKNFMIEFAKEIENYGIYADFFSALRGRVANPEASVKLRCFDYVRYGRGELAWRFTDAYWGFFATGSSDASEGMPA